MSNALSIAEARTVASLATAAQSAQTSPPSQPPPGLAHPLVLLLAISLPTFAVWVFRRTANPSKLSLRNTPGRPNSLSDAHAGVLLVAYFGSMIAAGSFAGTPWMYLALVGSQVVWLGASLVVASMTFRFGLWNGLGLSMRHWLFDTARGVVAYLSVVGVCLLLMLLMQAVLPPDAIREHVLLRKLPALSWHNKLMVLVSAVVLAPLAEEVFFRGIVQSMVRGYTGRPWLAIVFASVFFGLVHVAAPQDVLPVTALALVLGYNYERCGRLWAPILAHALFNGVFVALRLAGYS